MVIGGSSTGSGMACNKIDRGAARHYVQFLEQYGKWFCRIGDCASGAWYIADKLRDFCLDSSSFKFAGYIEGRTFPCRWSLGIADRFADIADCCAGADKLALAADTGDDSNNVFYRRGNAER